MDRRTFLFSFGMLSFGISMPFKTIASSKTLVVYFSKTGEQYGVGVISKGNTAIVAEIIAQKTGADLCEITVENDTYPTQYKPLCDVAKIELNNKARPAYNKTVADISGYDVIFIGAPVWWGDWPMVMYTFFEHENLAGKTLIPFSTHAGSGLSGFDKKLATANPKSKVAAGLAITGTDAQNNSSRVSGAVDVWLKKLAEQGIAF
ncbi:MAG: NAD(P)H-dependent oxidoreductase [Mailhella sp.]|nr:NAD(P)H-dependent oxidoreductase [Mailhella sp.]